MGTDLGHRGLEGGRGKGGADAIVLENRQTTNHASNLVALFYFLTFPFEIINGIRMNPTV